MAFREMFRFELAYRIRQPSTWIYLVLLIALTVLRADSIDTDVTQYHAPVQAASSMLMVGILATLITAGLFVETAQRDRRARIDPLFFAMPLRSWEYLGGRFAGSLLVAALLLSVVPAALMVAPRVLPLDTATAGTARLATYLLPFAAFLLPNLLVNAAVLFGVTVFTRRSVPAYLGALALTFAYMFALMRWARHGSSLWAWIDPTGAVALARQTAGWTRVELNALPVVFDGILLGNRLLWMAMSAAFLAFTVARFRRDDAVARNSGRAERSERTNAEELEETARHTAAPPEFGLRTSARQTLALASIQFRQIVLSREFLLIAIGLVVCAVIAVAEVWLFGGMLFWPLTRSVVVDLTDPGLRMLIAAVTVFYAGELVWRERDAGVETFGDAFPVPDWVAFAGKLLALCLVVVALHGLLAASGVFSQALQRYYAFQPLVYLQLIFGVHLANAVLFAVLALLVHVVVDQKYVGHFVAVLLYVGTRWPGTLGIEHNLLVYGSDPGWAFSDLNGFGPFLTPLVWFKTYWSAWALLLCVVALLFWRRGAEGGIRARLALARRRMTAPVRTAAAVAVLLVVATGGFVFYNTNVLNEYRTSWETDERYAEYERRYKRFEHIPQPTLKRVALHLELEPERREATMRAQYHLVNESGVAIESVHLTSVPRPEAELRRMQFGRAARPAVVDLAHGYRIYTFEEPLQPGHSMQMQFEVAVARRGFRNREPRSAGTAMVGTFTNLPSALLPTIGYDREAMELSSASARREHGLPPTDVRPSIHDARARQIPRIGRIGLETTVGTAGNHLAIVPGALQRSWTSGGRRYFHYRTEAPVLNLYSVLSAPYAVREARWNNVGIRVIHHPAHGVNADYLVRCARASLDYFTREFGPYPHRQIALVELPAYSGGARAYGGQIVYSEASPMAAARIGGRNVKDDPALTLAAHELAHQWWGQQLMGADVQGSQMLSETLAQYSALMVLERTHGAVPVRRILRRMHESYVSGRGTHRTAEVPLLLTADHSYLHYGKGAVVMYALQDAIGEERINAALRRFLRKHRMQGPPYPTTLDLYGELQAVTPAALQSLLHDLIATITSWDLRAVSAAAQPIADDEYRVTLTVEAAKLRSDSAGHHTAVAMDDPVDIGVFAATAGGDGVGQPLYLAKHRLRSGRQTIAVTVRGKPAYAGVDPYHKLIVRHSDALYERDVKIAAVKPARPAALVGKGSSR